MPAGKRAGKNKSAGSIASLSGTTEATVSVPSVVISLVLAQATDGSSILSPRANQLESDRSLGNALTNLV